MGEIKQKIDVLAPHYLKTLKYNGEQPSRVLKIIPPLMKSIFKVTSTNFFEDIVKWDNLTENNLFYNVWRGRDGKDERTVLWVEVRVQGEQNEKTKKGNVTIWLRSYLTTTFKYSNEIMKGLLRMYSYYFYSEQRRRYTEEARRLLDILEREIRMRLEIMVD